MKKKVMIPLAFLIVFVNMGKKETVEKVDVEYFSAYTEQEVFQSIPALTTPYCKIGDAEEQGSGCYVLGVDGTTEQDYKEYLLN